MQTIFRPANLLQLVLFVGLVLFLGTSLFAGAEALGYNWQWFRVPRYIYIVDSTGLHPGPLLKGLWVTVEITGYSLVLTLVIGLATALMRLSSSPVGNLIAVSYIEMIRNTPLLVQIFVVYFVLAPIFDVGRFSSAVLALSLFEGAYASEIIRAGILAIPRGQWESARALGLSTSHCYRHIILPQAFRQMAPPLTSQSVSLIKDSALVSTIAIFDLTMRGQQIVAETFLTFEIWITVAILYLVLTLFMSALVKILEWRLVPFNNS
jgi:polar amino acid transport system permease protein